MAKRIHELAKEWGIPSKDLIARLEELGMSGKRSQQSLGDDEVERLAIAFGRGQPAATVKIGDERVVGERLVTERAADREVTTRERITESRVRPDVIRRRTKRVEVVQHRDIESAGDGSSEHGSVVGFAPPPSMAPAAETSSAGSSDALFVPELDEGSGIDSGLIDLPDLEPEAEPIAPVARAGGNGAGAARADSAPAPEPPPPPPPPPPPVAQEAPAPRRLGPVSRIDPSAPTLDDGMRRVQVLGKIDLKKPEPPPPPRPRSAAPAPGAPAGAPAPTESTEESPRRRKSKKVIRKPSQFDPFGSERSGRMGRKPLKKRAAPGKEQKRTEITTPSARKRLVRISEGITVGDLAKAMGFKAGEVIKKLMEMGVMATVNHVLDFDHASLVASEFEYTVENVAFDAEKEIEGQEAVEVKGEPMPRDPVVTVMGHVDHGKTSLLDAIRRERVAEGEAGGITQHVGAYTARVRERGITFLDTPGHEAFTAMRARGAKVTDLVILVVAADDSVMPQTIEALNHARAASVPIIVAINKMDLPGADPERVKKALADHGLVAEDWGGDTTMVPVSAKTQEGLDQLLEMILLQADVLELKANPEVRARGTIIEAKLDRGRGPVATVLVQEGTLRASDPFVAGVQFGRIRAMLDWRGNRIEEAGPSTPVEILGLSAVPEAGDVFTVVNDEATARQIADHRHEKQRHAELSKPTKVSLDDLYKQLESANMKELRVVLKVDVQGSVDALKEAFARVGTDEVQVVPIHTSVGGVTESDVLLASASNAVIVGFNVRAEAKAATLAEREGVDIRLYTVIYDAINQIREALEGLLEPTVRERTVGRAEVRQIFGVSGSGVIAGSSVSDGKIQRGALARLLRDHAVVHQGKIGSLRRFKDDVREVTAGYECGIGLEGYNDLKPGDVIEVYELEQVARRITPQGSRGASQASAERVA